VLLTAADRLFNRGEYRAVLTKVQEALERYPHDDAQYKKLTQLRTKVRNLQGDRVRFLEAELEKAVYFDSLAGYRRLRDALATLVEAHGEEHLLQQAKIAAMRQKVDQTIARIEADASVAVRRKLDVLVKVYRGTGDKDMAQLIEGYIETLPKTGANGEDK
jgi:biotin synthase-related radical SAM superfamily protein